MENLLLVPLFFLLVPGFADAQQSTPAPDAKADSAARAGEKNSPGYSGMYTFLKEGEFVQVTVEDDGHVNGFISRFGDGPSDKGAFLDQFFKKDSRLEGSKLTFSTEIVHGVAFDFKGTIERGEGKNPGDEGYYVLKGTLSENQSDANKHVTSHASQVALKMFPQDASPQPAVRK
jgi:hypothetical protein